MSKRNKIERPVLFLEVEEDKKEEVVVKETKAKDTTAKLKLPNRKIY